MDATDRLVLDTAAELLAAAAPGEVVVLGDRHGARSLGAWGLHRAEDIRVHYDALPRERAILAKAHALGALSAIRALPLGADLVARARVVLMQQPRSLAELDAWCALIARHASPEVTVIAGGRIKHMTVAMNDVTRVHFGRLDIGHARQKSRVLVVSAAAVASARATAAANGVADRVEAVREDGLTERPSAGADLVPCNPPFHTGAAVTDALAGRLLADASRVLRPGSEVWTVYNSHLRQGRLGRRRSSRSAIGRPRSRHC